MQPPSAPRVQLVISGKFIALFLTALSLLGFGYYWHLRQQQAREFFIQRQERFKAPPYFVNRGASVIRSCQHCLGMGQLLPQPEWKVGPAKDIPASEQRWFLAVEDPPVPATVAGVLMLPVYPALRDDPSFGFDQTRVMLVLYQNLERKPWIEQPVAQAVMPPPANPAPAEDPKPSPLSPELVAEEPSPSPQIVPPSVPPPPEPEPLREPVHTQSPYVGNWKNADPGSQSLTRLLITMAEDHLVIHAWAKCLTIECDWGESTVPLAPVGNGLTVVWTHHATINRQETFLQADGRLKVSLKTHFKGGDGVRDMEIISYFTKVAMP